MSEQSFFVFRGNSAYAMWDIIRNYSVVGFLVTPKLNICLGLGILNFE